MNAKRAFEIVNLLADGINPYTGEVFSDGVFQHPDTVRALYIAKKALTRLINYEKRQQNLPSNAGVSWSLEEEDKLLAGFDTGKGIAELAKIHGRTTGAIQSRLVKLGKIER